jgi:hypothetical protein
MSKNKSTKKSSQHPKPTWQDALAAIAAKNEQHQRFARRWGKMYDRATTEMQSEEAVVFLGEDARKVLGQNTNDTAPIPQAATFQRPGKSAIAAGSGVVLATLAGYALSLVRVSRVM